MAQRNDGVEVVRTQANRSPADDWALSEQELLVDLTRVARQTTTSLSEREYATRGRFGVSTFHRRFGSWNEAKRRAGLQTRDSKRIDDDRLLDDLRRVARSLDGRLTERIYADRGEFGVTTLRRRFGSWNEAKRRAGLEMAHREKTTRAIGDDVERVADETDAAYVTPAMYAEGGRYPLSALPTEEAFWDGLRDRLGLSVTPLYHKVVDDAENGP